MDETKAPRQNRVTIQIVAKDAGVSVAAVSKVLRNAYGVSDALRSKVLHSIEKLGYRPSTAARGMRGKTYTVGVLLVEISNAFLPEIVTGIQGVLGAANYKTMIGVGGARARIEVSMIESMIDFRMDGLILVAPRLGGEPLARLAAQVPMVVIGHHEPGAQQFDTINSNDRLGARRAVEALVDAGRRDIAMISLPPRELGEMDVFFERELGYRAAMEAAGLSDQIRIVRLEQQPELIEGELTRFLTEQDLPEAVFCWSDVHAVPLINIAKSTGISVPERLAILGYDNTPPTSMPLIDLSSIDQNGPVLGQRAAKALLSRMGGRTSVEHMQIEPKLIRRSSL